MLTVRLQSINAYMYMLTVFITVKSTYTCNDLTRIKKVEEEVYADILLK